MENPLRTRLARRSRTGRLLSVETAPTWRGGLPRARSSGFAAGQRRSCAHSGDGFRANVPRNQMAAVASSSVRRAGVTRCAEPAYAVAAGAGFHYRPIALPSYRSGEIPFADL